MRRARELVAYAVALELGALAAAYAAFHKLNTDASSRAWAASNCPVVLRGFASEIRLARDEVAEMSPPPPLYALVPRGAFLPLWHARDGRCATHFARSLPPGVGEQTRLRLLPIRYDPVRVRGERRSLRRSFFFRALTTARFATRAP